MYIYACIVQHGKSVFLFRWISFSFKLYVWPKEAKVSVHHVGYWCDTANASMNICNMVFWVMVLTEEKSTIMFDIDRSDCTRDGSILSILYIELAVSFIDFNSVSLIFVTGDFISCPLNILPRQWFYQNAINRINWDTKATTNGRA